MPSCVEYQVACLYHLEIRAHNGKSDPSLLRKPHTLSIEGKLKFKPYNWPGHTKRQAIFWVR